MKNGCVGKYVFVDGLVFWKFEDKCLLQGLNSNLLMIDKKFKRVYTRFIFDVHHIAL